MVRYVFNTAVTVNGFLADPEDSLAWLFAVPEAGAPDMDAFTETVGALVMGSATYEWLIDNLGIVDDPGVLRGYYGDRPLFVFTTRDLPVPAGHHVRFLHGDVSEHLDAITAAAGDRDVWIMGGGDLVGQFLDAGALDEIILSIAPAFLAAGKPLLPRDLHGTDRLKLVSARKAGQFVEARYAVRP